MKRKKVTKKGWQNNAVMVFEPLFQIFVLCHHRAQLSRCTRNRRSEENKKLKTLEELCVLGFLRMITNIQFQFCFITGAPVIAAQVLENYEE